MLYEIPHPGQSNRHHKKRWFTSCDMDLFVWFNDDAPVRFQLSYDKQKEEKAINWNFDLGFRHYRVDNGESFPAFYPGRYKQTPILIDLCDQQNLASIAREFLAASQNIDTGIADFIYARLMAHPIATSPHHVMNTDPFRKR